MKIKIYSLNPVGDHDPSGADAENSADFLLQCIIFFARIPTSCYVLLFTLMSVKHTVWFPHQVQYYRSPPLRRSWDASSAYNDQVSDGVDFTVEYGFFVFRHQKFIKMAHRLLNCTDQPCSLVRYFVKTFFSGLGFCSSLTQTDSI